MAWLLESEMFLIQWKLKNIVNRFCAEGDLDGSDTSFSFFQKTSKVDLLKNDVPILCKIVYFEKNLQSSPPSFQSSQMRFSECEIAFTQKRTSKVYTRTGKIWR